MRHPYFLLSILTLGVFSVINTELGIIPILPELANAAHVSISQAGYLITVFALTVTFIGPLFTMKIAHWKLKNALLLAQVLILFGNLLIMIHPSYSVMFIARILGGLGHPLFFTLSLSFPAYVLPEDKKAQGTSMILMGVNLAFILGLPFISFLANVFSWKASLMFSISTNLLAILGIFYFFPAHDIGNSGKDDKQPYSFKDKGFIISIPVLTLIFTGIFVMYAYFAAYFRDFALLEPKEITISLILFGIFGFIGNTIVGILSPKKIAKWTIICSILLLLTFVLIYFPQIKHFTFALFMICTWGFIQSTLILFAQVWFTLNKITNIKAVNSMVVSSSNLGITLGSFLGGIIIAVSNVHILPLASSIMLLVVILLIALDSKIQGKK